MLKILHVIPSFYPARVYGGPIQSVYQLCRHLLPRGCEVRVLTTDANGPGATLDVATDREVELVEGLKVRYCKRVIFHSVSPALLRVLPSYIRWADVVHLTAVYSFTTIPTLSACKVMSKPVVWSPRGALQRWEGSTHPWLKGKWETVCRLLSPSGLILHATSEEEMRESRERFPDAEVIVIPNGIEISEKTKHVRKNGILRLLYIGRLHPKKGIENLLAAGKRLNGSSGMRWLLTIAGTGGRKYAGTIQDLIKELELSRQVTMVGEIQGEEKQGLFENTDIAIVPSHTENFGIVVAEALAYGVPVITSKGTPWRRVESIGCGLWVDNDPENLAKAIERMSRMPLRDMGQRGREWMQREFDWGSRAQEMLHCYQRALAGQVAHRSS